jgi:potassium-transporting ATPase potassium-binding subunit
VMLVLFSGGLLFTHHFEQRGNRLLAGVNFKSSATQPGGNMEGKEVRFGIAGTTLTGVVTSNTATGSTNAADDSFSSLGGMVLLMNMLLGELVFGGLGSGLYSMVMATAVAVFLAGLMVGRTPAFLGKKIGPAENKMIVLYALAAPLTILPLTAIALSTKVGLSGLTTNTGPHGLTAILFAYTSCFANNGQMFASLNANTVFYNLTTALAMIVGRFGLAIPALGFAGLFARQKSTPSTVGTLPTDSLPFGVLLTAFLVLSAGLSFLPAIALGPVLEHVLFRG